MQTTKHKKIKKNVSHAGEHYMPQDAMSLKILAQRRDHLAKKIAVTKVESQNIKYIRFKLNNEFYGIPYVYANEVLQHINLSKLPLAPPFIAGVMNRRGAIIAIFNLKAFFNISTAEEDSSQHVIVIKGKEATVGILADSIEGGDEYNPSLLDEPLAFNTMITPDNLLGLHQGDTAIINIENLMANCQDKLTHLK